MIELKAIVQVWSDQRSTITMLLCRMIVPLVYCTKSHCFLLPLQWISNPYLAIFLLSAPDLFQDEASHCCLPSPGTSGLLKCFGSVLYRNCIFLPGRVSEYPLIEKKLLVSTPRDIKIIIFPLASSGLVRFICFLLSCKSRKLLGSISHRHNHPKKRHVP